MTIKLVNFLDTDEAIQMKTLLWRNSKHVSKYFQIKNIDTETHKKWLNSLKVEKPKTIAFLIEYDGVFIGVTYFHSVNYEKAVSDWGIYIYDESLRGMGIGYKVLSQCIDYAKEVMHLKKIYLEVLETNIKAVKLYESMGFKALCKNENVIRYERILNGVH